MKYLTLIASGITLISSYTFAAEYKVNFNNKYSNETVTIFNLKDEPCPITHGPHCEIGPNQLKTLPVDLGTSNTTAAFVMSTVAMKGTLYMVHMKEPLPKNISFTHSYKEGHNYINILYDGKIHGSAKNEFRELPKNTKKNHAFSLTSTKK